VFGFGVCFSLHEFDLPSDYGNTDNMYVEYQPGAPLRLKVQGRMNRSDLMVLLILLLILLRRIGLFLRHYFQITTV
jgi:hypothetical protein